MGETCGWRWRWGALGSVADTTASSQVSIARLVAWLLTVLLGLRRMGCEAEDEGLDARTWILFTAI